MLDRLLLALLLRIVLLHYVRILGSRFHRKYSTIHFKINMFSEKSAKISFKMMEFDEKITKIASKIAQIALKHPKNEVLPF